MSTRTLLPLILALLLLTLAAACDGDGGGATPDDRTDTASSADAAASDGAADTTTGGDVAAPDTAPDSVPDGAVDVPPDAVADVPPDTAAAPDTGPDVVTPWPPVALEHCGAEPYEWLPPAGMGEVLAFRKLELINTFSAAQLDVILQQAGYGSVTPVANGVTIYRLRYVTQDHGERREATAAIGIPDSATADETVPIAIWMHHSVGFVDECSPSRDNLFAAVAPALLASQGYVSVAPDLLGLIGFGEGSPEGALHPYLVAEPTALAGLDAIRATVTATAADDTLPDGDPDRVIVAGGSQGGHAAFFVDRYAPHYAPELTIRAVAAIVPPTDLRALATKAVSEWASAARVLPTYLATMRNWYGAPADLGGVLTDTEPHHIATNIEELVAARCRFELRIDGVDALADLYDPDFLAAAADGDWDALPPWNCYLRESSVRTNSIPLVSDSPVYVVFAENDELIDLAAEVEDIPQLCAMGYRIEVAVCGGLAHTPGGQAAFPLLFDWLQGQLAGAELDPEATCVIPDPIDCEAL